MGGAHHHFGDVESQVLGAGLVGLGLGLVVAEELAGKDAVPANPVVLAAVDRDCPRHHGQHRDLVARAQCFQAFW